MEGAINLTWDKQTDRRKKRRTQKRCCTKISDHILSAGHKIDFKNTKTIAISENLATRTIREASEIEKRPKNLNKRDDA